MLRVAALLTLVLAGCGPLPRLDPVLERGLAPRLPTARALAWSRGEQVALADTTMPATWLVTMPRIPQAWLDGPR